MHGRPSCTVDRTSPDGHEAPRPCWGWSNDTEFSPSSVGMDVAVWGRTRIPCLPTRRRPSIASQGRLQYVFEAKAKTADDSGI